MATVASRVESYIKHQKPGTVFAFNTVVSRLGVIQKDTVNHALKKLSELNEIVHVKKGVYARPKMSRFGAIPVEPGKVVQVTAENNGANVYPYGAAVLNALGLSTQLSMSYSYIATKRITSFQLNNTNINIRYSRALERAEETITGLGKEEKNRVILLWISLEYLGEFEARQYKEQINTIFLELTLKAQKQLIKSFNRKLNWAKCLFSI
ncbi:MAG: hypothetical protein GY760_12105 [Deltaproteobacteria bacterium]|nr:hypothetical protein [Deltaproteobacteria bacterium]